MSSFASAYSEYYDAFYEGKDYAAEAAYIDSLLRTDGNTGLRILEFGCGTGRHALHLASLGHTIHGVDRSADMIAGATRRLTEDGTKCADKVSFETADIASYKSEETYDAVTALFHVMGYLTKTQDVLAALQSASHHLTAGGRFIFDFWYGPAVLALQPSVRVRRVETPRHKLTRIAEPELDCNANLVRVNYTVHSIEKDSGAFAEFREQHVMRYFFLPEIEHLLAGAGFTLERAHEWMSGSPPSAATWGVVIVARKC